MQIATAALPSDCPPSLVDVLVARGAEVTAMELDPPKTYLWLATPEGPPLFVWYSTSRTHEQVVELEAGVRKLVGTEPPLRAPPLLARGRLWRLERAIAREPLTGPAAIEAVVAAAEAIPRLPWQRVPRTRAREARLTALRRRLRTVGSLLPTRDFLRARAIVSRPRLPAAMSHGDFHRKHVLLEGGEPWVIDWELAGSRPRGYDLMTLWADIEVEEDRELLFDAATRAVGASYRPQLLQLRYAVLVQLIAANLTQPLAQNNDVDRAQSLLRLLPDARRQTPAG